MSFLQESRQDTSHWSWVGVTLGGWEVGRRCGEEQSAWRLQQQPGSTVLRQKTWALDRNSTSESNSALLLKSLISQWNKYLFLAHALWQGFLIHGFFPRCDSIFPTPATSTNFHFTALHLSFHNSHTCLVVHRLLPSSYRSINPNSSLPLLPVLPKTTSAFELQQDFPPKLLDMH